MIPGGNPEIDVPGEPGVTATSPFITVNPVFMRSFAATTPKVAAEPRLICAAEMLARDRAHEMIARGSSR